MKIGIIVRTKFNEQYKEIGGSKGRLLIEMAVLKILKNEWPQHKFVTLNAHKLNVKLAKSCDFVWFSFEDLFFCSVLYFFLFFPVLSASTC